MLYNGHIKKGYRLTNDISAYAAYSGDRMEVLKWAYNNIRGIRIPVLRQLIVDNSEVLLRDHHMAILGMK